MTVKHLTGGRVMAPKEDDMKKCEAYYKALNPPKHIAVYELEADDKLKDGDFYFHPLASGRSEVCKVDPGYVKSGYTMRQMNLSTGWRMCRYVENEEEDELKDALWDELEWAWENLVSAGDNLSEMAAHRAKAGELLGRDFTPKFEEG